MTGELILKNLFKLIHNHYALAIADFDEQVDNFWAIQDSIDQLKSHGRIIAIPKIHSLLDAFSEVHAGADFITEEYVELNNVELLDFTSNDFRKRNRAFSYSDAQFGYLSLKKLHKITPLSSINPASQDYRTLIDYLSTGISKGESEKVTTLLTYIQNSNEDWGILVHKFNHTHNSLSIYSYIYYRELLQGGKIELDPILNYRLLHGATTTFNGTVKYEQYFEVYDIINELNHSDNLVTRFLKVYHILEYLVYRVELVDIEKKARLNRTFIREIHGLTGKGQADKEFDVFKRNFKEIFKTQISAGAFNLGVLGVDVLNFLKNYWDLDNFNSLEVTHFAKLIYKIRNSIVHNKESEFHITTTNPDDYQIVIPLIRQLIQILEKQAFDKISTDSETISYKNQNIELY